MLAANLAVKNTHPNICAGVFGTLLARYWPLWPGRFVLGLRYMVCSRQLQKWGIVRLGLQRV